MNARVPTLPTPDDLASDVDHLEPLEQVSPIGLQGRPVGTELLIQRVLQLVGGQTVARRVHIARRNDDRRLADDPVAAVHQLAKLRERLQAVARASLLRDLLRSLFSLLRRFLFFLRGLLRRRELLRLREAADRLHQLLFGQAGIPDVHRGHLRELGHRRPVGTHRGERPFARLGLAEAVVTRRDREARRHALHVVLERARQRLVEVVQVEQQGPLRRGEQPEVRQMSIAAELNHQAGPGRVLQIGGHDLGRPPIKSERRHHHPPVAHRHKVRLTRRRPAPRATRPDRGDPQPASNQHAPTEIPSSAISCRALDVPQHSDAQPSHSWAQRLPSGLSFGCAATSTRRAVT